MLDGIKLLFFRFLQGITILVVLSPVIVKIKSLATDTAADTTFAPGAIDLIKMGLDLPYFIVGAGIVAAVFYAYCRATRNRRYDQQEEQTYYRRMH